MPANTTNNTSRQAASPSFQMNTLNQQRQNQTWEQHRSDLTHYKNTNPSAGKGTTLAAIDRMVSHEEYPVAIPCFD